MTPEQYRDLWKVKHQMNTGQQQRIEQIESGDQPWRKTAYELGDVLAGHESDVDFLLSIVKGQAGNDERLWFSQWPTVNGFYWLRGWRHYGDLPICIDGETFWMMFNLARNHRTDLDDSEDVQFLGPITPYSGVTAATSMRSLCVEKVAKKAQSYQADADNSSLLPNYRGRMGFAATALREVAKELETLTLQEQKS